MASHMSEIHSTGRCGTLQTLVQSKGAYADLIAKEQRRALAGPRITPSNQPSAEWVGGQISLKNVGPELHSPNPSASEARRKDGVGAEPFDTISAEGATPSAPRGNTPSFMMQALQREQQRQARHEAALRHFKRLGAAQLLPADPSQRGPSEPIEGSPHKKFMGVPVYNLFEPSKGAAQDAEGQGEKKVGRGGGIGKAPKKQAKVADTLFADANEAATMRARARKERQQQHNAAIGNFVTDQSATSPMFATALRDPIAPRNVLLCDDSAEDRRRMQLRETAARDRIAGYEREQNRTSPQKKQKTAEAPRLPPLPLSPLRLGSPQQQQQQQQTPPPAEVRDAALLSLMQRQAQLLARQVSLEAEGQWAAAGDVRALRESVLPIVTTRSDEEALVRRGLSEGSHAPVDGRTRRERALQYREDNRHIRRGARSALDTMHLSPTEQREIAAERRRAASSLARPGISGEGSSRKSPQRTPFRKGHHQPSSLFPSEGPSFVFRGGKKNNSMR